MKTCKKLHTTRMDLRPRDVPLDWLVFNAPRPLVGDQAWQGEWCKGVFYAAVNPDGSRAAWMIEENRLLDASELVFILFADALSSQKERVVARYPARDVSWYADDSEHANTLVGQYLDDLNDGIVHLPVDVM